MGYIDWISNEPGYSCPRCQAEVRRPGDYPMAECPSCGWRPVPELVRRAARPKAFWGKDDVGPYCPVCHRRSESKTNFCGHCGVRLR